MLVIEGLVLKGAVPANNRAAQALADGGAGPASTPAARVPARSTATRSPPAIVWSPVPRATFYWLQLIRVGLPGTRKILDAFPVRPRLALRAGWVNGRRHEHLTPGRYRWYVWPQYGHGAKVRYTELLRQGIFVVKAAPWLKAEK
jgi:hypothetical protein